MSLQERLSFYGARVTTVQVWSNQANYESGDLKEVDESIDNFLAYRGFVPASSTRHFPIHILARPDSGNLVTACFDSESGWGINGDRRYFKQTALLDATHTDMDKYQSELIDEGRSMRYQIQNNGFVEIYVRSHLERIWQIMCKPEMDKIQHGKNLLRISS